MKTKIKAIVLTMLMIISILSTFPTNTIADSDTIPPELTNASESEETIGFGHNTYIAIDIYDNQSGINTVKINITYPDDSYVNLTMNNTQGANYQHNFTDAWLTGQYNYTIWVKDNANNTNITTQNSFNISAEAVITLSTIKDIYYDNETINLTDPPMAKSTYFPNNQIGYKYLDDGDTLWLWNRYDNYYFDTKSGIQLTNHKKEYWSHNVLMLGYYNNDQWNLIYRTDELSGFNNNIETDNQTYINITQWKDLTYQGYNFRLAIRYHLGINDNELTIIPYIKNLGTYIPYTLGFAWEIKDIQIAMTETDDHLEINGSSYPLNQPMNHTFSNMTQPIYGWNTTTNQTYIKDYTPIPYFHIKEYFPNGRSESLYLRWNHTLTYQVNVQSQEGQYNAPITLGIKIGTLQPNQEKQTTLYWHDASQTTYYFNSYDKTEQWTYEPSYMADGSTNTYAYTSSGDIELLDDNSYEENEGTILKVELRTRGYCYGGQRDITLRPVFSGSTDGSNYTFEPSSTGSWSSWYDITTDANAPSNWTWTDISDLECDVEAESGYMFSTSYCAKVELRVTYTDTPPETTIYYFDRCVETETWAEAHEYMVDGNIETFAYTDTKTDVELLDTNTCTVEDTGEVYKIEIRALGHHGEENGNISLRPVFNGTTDGSEYLFYTPLEEPGWSDWFDITNDANAPTNWTWQDVTNLDCDVIAIENESGDSSIDVYCGKVEIRVTYVPTNNPPGISNPIPTDESDGINLTPVLSIMVNDANGDTMNISWLTNYSGNWTEFESNTSVGNGTYRQNYTNATENGKWWYWRVNVTDGVNYSFSDVHSFYTGYESKLVNTGTTNISGYLEICILYESTILNKTIFEDLIYIDSTPRTINASETIPLDTIVNGIINSSNLSLGNGTYQIHAILTDPYGQILESNDGEDIEAYCEFNVITSYLPGWHRLALDGFGNRWNIATRGVEVYNNELFVGTQNVNLTKLWEALFTFLVDLVKETITTREEYNNFASTFVQTNNWDEWGVDISVTQACFEDYTNDTIQQIKENASGIVSAKNLGASTYNILEVFDNQNNSNYISSNNSFIADYLLFGFNLGGILSRLGILEGLHITNFVTRMSDGCSLWKYNSTENAWTELVGNHTDTADFSAGFGNYTNCAVTDIEEFNGDLYVGTWRAPHDGGCEIWRYNGSAWVQVVGKNAAYTDAGFGDGANSGAWTMYRFNGSLYVGTLNSNFTSTGYTQIWRTQDGNNWTKVVDQGFLNYPGNNSARNVYSWQMAEYQDELYVGTFNAYLSDDSGGCQIWKSPNGSLNSWQKVNLSGGDGFGETANWGVRGFTVLNNELYAGTACKVTNNSNGLEIWRLNGSVWTPVVGDNVTTGPDIVKNDGFDSFYNKYAWSMNVTSDGYLWVGTANGRPWPPESFGCEVWRYNGSNWTGIVNTTYGELDNGFGSVKNAGARSMIQYPNSGDVFVGTFRAYMGNFTDNQPLRNLCKALWNLLVRPTGFDGCEVWYRKK